MTHIVTIAGSPSNSSKSAAVLALARRTLFDLGVSGESINVRDLNAEDLLYARTDSPSIANTFEWVAQADGILVATPIYKAAYSGILKAYFDLLPANAFAGKVVLPIATGASPTHTLAIDYALRPVLVALGSSHILNGVYLLDSQWITTENKFQLDALTSERFTVILKDFARLLDQQGS